MQRLGPRTFTYLDWSPEKSLTVCNVCCRGGAAERAVQAGPQAVVRHQGHLHPGLRPPQPAAGVVWPRPRRRLSSALPHQRLPLQGQSSQWRCTVLGNRP